MSHFTDKQKSPQAPASAPLRNGGVEPSVLALLPYPIIEHRYPVGKELCHKVTELTSGHAHLLLHLSSERAPYETDFSNLLVVHAGFIYGTLYISSIPRNIAQILADSCSLILRRYEQEVQLKFLAQNPSDCFCEPLTPRERDVLVHMIKGYRRAEIAELLALSATTVASHVKRVYSKLGVNNATHAVYKGRELGLFDYLEICSR